MVPFPKRLRSYGVVFMLAGPFVVACFAQAPGRSPAKHRAAAEATLTVDSTPLPTPGTEPPLAPPPPGLNGASIFQQLVAHSETRDHLLQRFTELQTLAAANPGGKVYASEVVRLQFQAPDHKQFQTVSQRGSAVVRHLVLNRLVESQQKTASGKRHRQSSITPQNYRFELWGVQQLGAYRCYVVQATPLRKGKYLFSGRMWINEPDFGIVRISGAPAKNPSFWVEEVHFVRDYQHIGPFWLPRRDFTRAKLRLLGWKLLSIDHRIVMVNDQPIASAPAPRLPAK